MLGERDRRILALAFPALGTLAIEPLYVLVDTAIVGRLGTVPLGGLALASVVLTTLVLVCNFLAYGTTARVAFLVGSGDRRSAAGIGSQGLWLSGLIGVPVAVLVALAGRPLVGLLGGSGAIADAATTYLRISALGVPAVLVALVGHGYLRGVSDTRTPLLVALVANVANVVLELVLVYGVHLGIAGSAWGTVIAQLLAAAWFLGLLGRRIAAAGAPLRPVGAELRRLLIAGRHLLVRTAALLATLAIATSVASRVSATTLGGHQIALQLHSFVGLALDALAIPGQIMIGTALGGADLDEARAVAHRLLAVGLVCGVAVGIAFAVLAPVVPHVFSHDPAVRERAEVALLVAALVQPPAAVAFVMDGVLIGASDFRFLQYTMIAAFVAFLPVAGAVLRDHRLGVAGVWAGLLAWMLTRAGFTWWRLRSGRWTAAAEAVRSG